MRLLSLRVHGFKSFADATEIEFHQGITAIVGPNGCGKSNISDAIRWVLGEQRPTAIRGVRMEEAIFQGSVNRRPINRGSVTMVVTNEDGALPVPFQEVEIGRRVYRDGGSDYSINRSVVRLKDVLDVVRDTGLGANAYSVIENRMIDAILSDRADERRGMFEEAAGIGKYKDRRKAAMRGLERAEMDLQRLEDVIAEVETKVRSLARQKGKAERFLELRAQRLGLEMFSAGQQLTLLGERLGALDQTLEGGEQSGEGMVAEVRAAEARYETLRLQEAEVEKQRSAAGAALETIRSELVRWERELAVAAERAVHAGGRMAQIGLERFEAAERRRKQAAEGDSLSAELVGVEAEVESARADAAKVEARVQEVRSRLLEAREALDGLETRERELSRRAAQLEGDAESAGLQATELGRRLERLGLEVQTTSEVLSDLETQGDLFSSRLDSLARNVDVAGRAVAAGELQLEVVRQEFDSARAREMEAEELAAGLAARVSALESMDRDREGLEPVVKAALAQRAEGVHGVLADFMEAPADLARAVETYLGPLARGLVVRDSEVALKLQQWFEQDWGGGGGLVLLPLDRVPEPGHAGSLLGHVVGSGEGAAWVQALLAEVDLVDGDGGLHEPGPRGVTRLSRSGGSADRMGVVRVGNPSGATGFLDRREQLRSLGRDAEAASASAIAARTLREGMRERRQQVEAELEAARTQRRDAEDAHRTARAEVAEQVDRRARMDNHREEISRQVEGTRAAVARALERARASREERATLEMEEEVLRLGRQEARGALEGVQEEWDAARTEEGHHRVSLTRLEGRLASLQERLGSTRANALAAEARLSALDVEEGRLRLDLEGAERVRTEGAQANTTLFQQRTDGEEAFRKQESLLTEVREALREAERHARDARLAERDAAELRHRLELERQETRGRIERIRERLEGEWGRPLEALLLEAASPEGPYDADALDVTLRDLVGQIERLLPVNMLAVEEHAEESQRLTFLREQHDDLVKARDDLRSAIRRINQTATELFSNSFDRIRTHFRSVHQRLFEGGEADIWLADADDPLESPIEIHASPHGKKTQRIDLLSGGERALTALSLLFAIYLVKPSPFCVLDEVDAPLDENNIGRFIRLLEEFKAQTQFVVITHNPRTIESADWIYGVTMEEPGVSTIVGVRLEQALEQARGTAA